MHGEKKSNPPQGRGDRLSCPAGNYTQLLGSPLPSTPATGCAEDTLPWHEMPLPCELLPKGPGGAAAPGSCSIRVPVHPGRGLALGTGS